MVMRLSKGGVEYQRLYEVKLKRCISSIDMEKKRSVKHPSQSTSKLGTQPCLCHEA
jgi:hypothetical protein